MYISSLKTEISITNVTNYNFTIALVHNREFSDKKVMNIATFFRMIVRQKR